MAIPTLISTSTASNSSSIDITSGIDSTYDEYMFVFTDIGPATDNVNFTFQVNAAGASGYNETITSSFYRAYHQEDDSAAVLGYQGSYDQAEGTGAQALMYGIGNGGDESGAGTLWLFNPSNTTYVKHFQSVCNSYNDTDYTINHYGAGYINTTTAIDDIQFKFSSGNFDGTIKMYGVG